MYSGIFFIQDQKNNVSLILSILFPSEPADQGCHGDEEQQTDAEDSPCYEDGEAPLTPIEQHIQQRQNDTQVRGRHENKHTHTHIQFSHTC